jgi:hypothetical protein
MKLRMVLAIALGLVFAGGALADDGLLPVPWTPR